METERWPDGKGKRALITGGASGIGFETLRVFAAEGPRVAVRVRSNEAFEPVRREFGDAVLCIASDAGDAPGQKRLAEAVWEPDVLFVNAGIADREHERGEQDLASNTLRLEQDGNGPKTTTCLRR